MTFRVNWWVAIIDVLMSIKLFKSRIIWFILVQRLWLKNFYWGFVMSIKLIESRIIWFMLVQRLWLNNFYWGLDWMTHHVNLSVEDVYQIIQFMNNLIHLGLAGCNGQVLFWAFDWMTQCCFVNCCCFVN